MTYGFDKNAVSPMSAIQLPKPRETVVTKPAMENVLKAGAELGFVSREPVAPHRKPGPRRTEAQDKITVTGPKRILDRLKAYCEKTGETSYCRAIEALLDAAEK